MARSRIGDSRVDSLEVKQAKIEAVEQYKEEQAQERENINGSDASTEIARVITDMSLYKAFEETPEIDHALVGMDSHIIEEPYDSRYGFDDAGELAQLKESAQTALNKSIGTPVEGLARATFDTITRREGQILADLVFDGEKQVF